MQKHCLSSINYCSLLHTHSQAAKLLGHVIKRLNKRSKSWKQVIVKLDNAILGHL